MPILENCCMMFTLMLDCSYLTVVYFMAPKHGALILQTLSEFVYHNHGTNGFETLYNYYNNTHIWILVRTVIVNCNNTPYIFCVQYRIILLLLLIIIIIIMILMCLDIFCMYVSLFHMYCVPFYFCMINKQ